MQVSSKIIAEHFSDPLLTIITVTALSDSDSDDSSFLRQKEEEEDANL